MTSTAERFRGNDHWQSTNERMLVPIARSAPSGARIAGRCALFISGFSGVLTGTAGRSSALETLGYSIFARGMSNFLE